MPIYLYRCAKCGSEIEVIHNMKQDTPDCCGSPMLKLPTCPAMVKMKGMGGYPSRRKFVKGTAPYTTRESKAWLDSDPYESTAKAQDWGREAES